MWDLIVSVPDHCLSFYFVELLPWKYTEIEMLALADIVIGDGEFQCHVRLP